jgi:hypothetical protein
VQGLEGRRANEMNRRREMRVWGAQIGVLGALRIWR